MTSVEMKGILVSLCRNSNDVNTQVHRQQGWCTLMQNCLWRCVRKLHISLISCSRALGTQIKPCLTPLWKRPTAAGSGPGSLQLYHVVTVIFMSTVSNWLPFWYKRRLFKYVAYCKSLAWFLPNKIPYHVPLKPLRDRNTGHSKKKGANVSSTQVVFIQTCH